LIEVLIDAHLRLRFTEHIERLGAFAVNISEIMIIYQIDGMAEL
jgi:hypothetical protein